MWYRVRRNPELGCPAWAGLSNSAVMSRGFARCCPGSHMHRCFRSLYRLHPKHISQREGFWIMSWRCIALCMSEYVSNTCHWGLHLTFLAVDLYGNTHFQVSRRIFRQVCKTLENLTYNQKTKICRKMNSFRSITLKSNNYAEPRKRGNSWLSVFLNETVLL